MTLTLPMLVLIEVFHLQTGSPQRNQKWEKPNDQHPIILKGRASPPPRPEQLPLNAAITLATEGQVGEEAVQMATLAADEARTGKSPRWDHTLPMELYVRIAAMRTTPRRNVGGFIQS